MKSLFWHRNPYDLKHTDMLFLQKVISNAVFQFDNCMLYRSLLIKRGFTREKLLSISSPAELDVKKYGVIVSCGDRRGLLLPGLEGVDTIEQQIDIARQKGGISSREKYTLERFEVVRHL